MNVTLLCLLWIVWCAMHSILIDPYITNFVKYRFSELFRYYRMLYNGFSLVTLMPLVVVTYMSPGAVVFSWDGYAIIGRGFLLMTAMYFFSSGAKHYDLQHFLGTRQARTGESQTLLSDSKVFQEKGVFGITRHPWYLGTMLLVWSILQNYSLTEVFVAVVLSSYLVVGSLLEERKIIAEYGDRYRHYQQQVSMIIPVKWLWRKMVS